MTATEATNNLELLDQVDAIIFGTPTYMGTVAELFGQRIGKVTLQWTRGKAAAP